jgi:hypothetical protein
MISLREKPGELFAHLRTKAAIRETKQIAVVSPLPHHLELIGESGSSDAMRTGFCFLAAIPEYERFCASTGLLGPSA